MNSTPTNQTSNQSDDSEVSGLAIFGGVAAVLFGFWWLWGGSDSPREVCEAFVAADNSEAAKEWVTVGLYPAIDRVAEYERLLEAHPELDDDSEFHEQLTFESVDSTGQRAVVGFQIAFPDAEQGEPTRMSGEFALLRVEDNWKINEWFITQVDGVPLEDRPTFYQLVGLAMEEAEREIRQRSSRAGSVGPSRTASKEAPAAWDVEDWMRVMGVLCMAGFGIHKFFQDRKGKTKRAV